MAATAIFLASYVLNAGEQYDDEYAISASISAISLSGSIEGIKIQSAEDVEKLDIYTNSRSRRFLYRGDPQLTFFREVEDEEAGEVIRKPVGSVTISRNDSRYLLFFMPRSSADESYNIFAFEDDLSTFPSGSLRFLNFTSHPVGVRIGDQREVIQSLNFSDIRGDFEHGNYYQAVFVSAPEGREPFRSYSGRIFFNQRMRMIFLIFPDPDGEEGSINFRAIREAVQQ